MTYSDALISQLSLLDYWRQNTEESQFIYERLDRRLTPISARSLQQHITDIFSRADTYYISEEIADVLVGGFDTLPSTPLGEVRPNSRYGWAFFQRPIACPFPTQFDHMWEIKGLAWGPFGRGNSAGGLNLGVFVRSPQSSHLPCSGMTSWPWESGWESLGEEIAQDGVADRELADWIRKLAFAFFAFIRQECVSIQTTPASRPIRRHLPKAYTAEPVIKIIQLRRRSPATTSGTAEQRDYSCRWLVRGHWRNQFYPSSQSHRPRFIPAYVKGPDDKPLKATKSAIFAVVR
jgi:hypothetical protein